MVAVEGIAATAEIEVAAVFVKHVIEAIVQPAEVIRRPVLAPLGRVVEHDVQEHLDAAQVKLADHVAEFIPGLRPLRVDRVGRLRRPNAIGL